jgi:uncharacterized protein (DUF1015 family)
MSEKEIPMAIFQPFRALRPLPMYAPQIAALPYDTMSTEEARTEAADKPYSFLHVDKAEIDLPPDTGLYADAVYAKAAETLSAWVQHGIYQQEDKPCYYIYRQTWRGRSQTGLVGCAGIDDYKNNIIKKHELTHPDKETDRIRHVTACNANTGPIFLTYRDTFRTATILNGWIIDHSCEVSFMHGEVLQEIWVIDDPDVSRILREFFAQTPALYIADGHHRCASAARVGFKRREETQNCTGEEEFNFFLAVAFPEDQLAIMDYNRIVEDLNGLAPSAFLSRLEDVFSVEPFAQKGNPYHPEAGHYFGMYLDGLWYRCRARRGRFDANDPVGRLDVEILQANVLSPILGIHDPRRDKRIAFIGGIRGLGELERRCESGGVAFAMYPTTLNELMDIADSGNIMPPKSTWFEPKLLSGLFIHMLV